MAMGRPPIDFSDQEVIDLGKDLVAWIKNCYEISKPPIHLTEWYFLKKDLTYAQWDLLRRRDDFRQYYDSALEMMTFFTQQNKDLSSAYGSRFLGVYSKDLRAHEKEIAQEKLKKEDEDRQMNLSDLKKALSDGDVSQK